MRRLSESDRGSSAASTQAQPGGEGHRTGARAAAGERSWIRQLPQRENCDNGSESRPRGVDNREECPACRLRARRECGYTQADESSLVDDSPRSLTRFRGPSPVIAPHCSPSAGHQGETTMSSDETPAFGLRRHRSPRQGPAGPGRPAQAHHPGGRRAPQRRGPPPARRAPPAGRSDHLRARLQRRRDHLHEGDGRVQARQSPSLPDLERGAGSAARPRLPQGGRSDHPAGQPASCRRPTGRTSS